MTQLLQTINLTKRFGGLTAVRDVSFTLSAGEVIGLLGPNGSGKTTLLNMISGAHRATSGQIEFEGLQIQNLRPDQISKRGIARTFQLVKVLPSMTVLENAVSGLAFGSNPKWGHEAESKAMEKLHLVGLADKAELPAASLTYIDSKRLELARALAADPHLLLLDEWLSGLTPEELKTGIELIKSIRDAGASILIVEHIMSAIRELCPRCIVMNAGEKIADGPTDEVLRQQDVIEAYLGAPHHA
ncbi:ABC transporter ATP-binding protein [Sneathiella limimaris]|uniref:ABC transporter ATP-binding protein n=1 Tax=Sneathiella limimaris TaxID=1964213 RepID=UPI00146B0A84|nr:ABC transporter ATP-binding protein [Sneathiella limimaris]